VVVAVRDTAAAKARIVSPPLGWLLSAMSQQWMDASLQSPATSAEGYCRRQNASGMERLKQRRRDSNTGTR